MVEGRTHKPVIDIEKCDICSVCIRGCPAEIIPDMRNEESSLRGRIYKESNRIPSLNINKVFDVPPCQSACPIHQDVRIYTDLIADKKYQDALKVIKETNALPSVCGYICHHPCELECLRNLVDEPVAIKALKRFVADFDNGKLVAPKVDLNRGKVVIIGSGPAGLAAGYDLIRMGYKVEVLEAFSEPGGMLRWAIPPFRLPRDILNRDIAYIERMGISIKTGIKFGIDITFSDLKKEGADAVIMAIGTHQGIEIGIEKEEYSERYLDCLTFLKRYIEGELVDLGDRTVVVGGGNAAVDSARSAIRTGIKEATIVYRRSNEEMPADRSEIEEAQAEGVAMHYLAMPVGVVKRSGKIKGLKCIETRLGEADESGRRRPIPVTGSEFILETDSIIAAVGQRPDISWNLEELPFKFSPMNTFRISDNYLTNIEGVFAAGDALTGPTTVVEAMASGRNTASAVNDYLVVKGQEKSDNSRL